MRKSLEKAVQLHVDSLNRLLNTTITRHRLAKGSPEMWGKPICSFAFADDEQIAHLHSELCGELWLYIGQRCYLKDDGKLGVMQYSYGISPVGAEDFTLRWDYEKEARTGKYHCRHHLQGAHDLSLGDATCAFNDLHLPTGYVPIEDVIRFCINDLRVRPIDEDWDTTISKSAAQFRARLTETV